MERLEATVPASLGVLSIGSPDDAWNVLGQIADGSFDIGEYPNGIRFDSWHCELFRVPHDPVHSSISTSMMKVFIDYQTSLNRAYKKVKYGADESHRLKDYEKNDLELKIIVSKNGSVYDAESGKALAAFGRELVAKMESKHIAVTAIASTLIVATGFFGADAFKAYYAAQKDIRQIEENAEQAVKLSVQETERAKIFGQIAAQNEEYRQAIYRVEAGYQALLKGAVISGGARIHGVEVSAEAAAELTAKPRRTGEGFRADGFYEIVDIKREGEGLFAVLITGGPENSSIWADARTLFLPDDQIDLLLSSLKTGRKLFVMLNAWRRGNSIASAEIIRAQKE